MPTVSINLCCYNSEKYLRETLESLIEQTYNDWELVIINDGSSDSTESIIFEYKSKGYPIIYQYQENKGLGASRNEALKLSRGEYIAFIDHDDTWLPVKLEKQVSILDLQPEIDFVYSNYYRFSMENSRTAKALTGKQPEGEVFRRFLYNYPVGILTVLLRRKSLVRQGLWFDESLKIAEEFDLFMRFLYKSKAAYLGEPLARYRIHSGMSTFKYISGLYGELEYMINRIKRLDESFENEYSDAIRFMEIKYLKYRSAKVKMQYGDTKGARSIIAPYKWFDIKSFLLYIASYLPPRAWFFMHRLRGKGSLLNIPIKK
jgi:glycosyltransferase involved in cell wall biosynthesis